MTFCISLVIALSLTSAGFNAQLIVRLQVQTAVRCRVDEFRSRKLCSIPHSCFLYRTGTILTVGIRTAIVRNTVFILISKPAFLTGAVLRFHQDSLIRTEWSVQTLKDRGVPIEKITGGIANWERSQASALMEQWLELYPDTIELVISNNDDMALGAIDALDRAGGKKISVVGIDGTTQGQDAVQSGKMLGTVSSDKTGYANAIFTIAAAAGMGEPIPGEITLDKGKYYWSRQNNVVKEKINP